MVTDGANFKAFNSVFSNNAVSVYGSLGKTSFMQLHKPGMDLLALKLMCPDLLVISDGHNPCRFGCNGAGPSWILVVVIVLILLLVLVVLCLLSMLLVCSLCAFPVNLMINLLLICEKSAVILATPCKIRVSDLFWWFHLLGLSVMTLS